MSAFVNYQKRGIELPPGCKDLIDVLRLAGETETELGAPVENLPDLGAYLSRFISSPAAVRSLWIHEHKHGISLLGVFWGKHGLRVFVLVDASREQAVRTVFDRAGLTPMQDDFVQGMHGLQFALNSFSGIEDLVRDVLIEGFGVTHNSPLHFRFHEKNAA